MPRRQEPQAKVECSKCGAPMTVPPWLVSAAEAWNKRNRRKDAIKDNDLALCDA